MNLGKVIRDFPAPAIKPRARASGGTIRTNRAMEVELLKLANGKRPRREAALFMERLGWVTVGASDQPVRITKAGRDRLREFREQAGIRPPA